MKLLFKTLSNSRNQTSALGQGENQLRGDCDFV